MDTITVTPRSATLPSPKVTKAKPPTLSSSIPSVWCGCEHLQLFFDEDKTRESCIKQYTRIQLTLNERPATITQTLTPANPDGRVSVSLSATYLCLQCSVVNNAALRERHFDQRKHNFSVESSSGCLYCQQCNDFIYDPWLEEVRLQKSRSKRKFDDMNNSEDTKLILQNSSFLPCRAIGLRGLYNMGQTCFMSVILQALIHNPFLKAYYLSEGHRSGTCEREGCTSCALDEIFTEFYSIEKTEGYGAVSMLLGSWLGAQALAGYQQQDAHEYLQFILNSLHHANSGPSPSSTPSSGDHTQNTSNNDADCNCIIHQSFSGKLHSTVTCSKCKNTTTALDPVLDLSLDLRNQAKKRKIDVEKPEDGVFDLKDCLERFTSKEKLAKGEYTCHNCHDTPQDATKQLSIQKLPPVLCVHLKRFSHTPSSSQKLSTPIRFPLTLDMYPFTTNATKSLPSGVRLPTTATYTLNSVIVHKGSMDSGHYVSYCREGEDWFLFDDSKVVLVNEKEVLAAEAYLLMYIIGEL